MRHFVNISLLLFFFILVISGALRFLEPFSIVTTRVHIVSGIAITVLVGFHLVVRLKYFAKLFQKSPNPKKPQNRIPLYLSIFICAFATAAAIYNWTPTTQLINQSYEARKRVEIFRPDERSAYEPLDNGARLKRLGPGTSNVYMEIDWGPEYAIHPSGAKPQIAIWAESSTRTLIETLHVSGDIAYSEEIQWGDEKLRRVDVLPIWRHRYTQKWGIEPDGKVDSMSGATPDHDFSIDRNIETVGKAFTLYVEVNAPFDSNEHYNSDQNKFSSNYTPPGIGQPSLIYGAYIDPNKDKKYHLLDLVGHGGEKAPNDGQTRYDTAKLTTAKNLIEKILVRVEPN
ncbi:MAG: DUF4405 domain-containing protein [Verrucomicrobiota bacterium]